jgi:quercetin dioxygenase-like cupin family protein
VTDDRLPTEVVSLSELDARPHADAFGDGEPRTIRLTLDEGEAVPEHTHPDRNVVIAVLSGELALSLDGTERTLSEGDLIRFDGRREVSPRARTATTALVVLAPARGE